MKNSKNEKSFDSFLIVKICFFTLFLLYAISLLLPLVWGFFMSLKTRVEFVIDQSKIFPKAWQFINYLTAWTELTASGSNMLLMFINNLWFAFGVVFVTMFLSATSAYVIAKYNFPGKRVISTIALITQIIPIMGSFAAFMRVTLVIGFYDNPLVCIALGSSFGYNFILLTSFFRNVSWEYAEAAFIDGAGHTKVFLQVMLPQAITPVLTLALTAFIGYWSDYYNPLLYLPSFPTLSSGLFLYQTVSVRYLNWPVLFAGLLLTMVPILILFFIFQRSILDLQFGGGLKG